MTKGDPEPTPIFAAAYVRMSTEHQQYSTSNQMDVNREYAKRRGMVIVKEYSDEGKSGLNIEGRDSLAQMIREVQNGEAKFSCILVYDISRWGRFQDADESAYYEYLCRRAGVAVHYCAEQFENDGSPVSTIVKGVKRAMAGEYSRELSSKVFQGACRLIQLGYKQGGAAGFGLRRMLVDQGGQQKGTLKIGEQKSIQTDRVILVPGPEEEIKVVRWIYQALLTEGKMESEIAALLNAQGMVTDLGRAWTRGSVHQVLTNEKYIGNNVYHRTSFKLKRKHIVNPRDKWIRAEGVFQGIIDPDLFFKAHELILARSQKLTDEEMLEKLRWLLNQRGHISGILIDYSFIEVNRKLRQQHPEIVASVIRQVQAVGATAIWDAESDLLHLNGELRVSIVLCRHTTTSNGLSRWLIRLDASLKPDITIAVRMDAANEKIHDYYLLPGIDMTWENLRVAEENGVYLDAYRFETLDYFYGLVERIKIEEAA